GGAHLRTRNVDEVDHARRQPRLLVELHQEVRRVRRRRRRLPHDRVAHQRGRGRQVAGDRGEVERCHREDEALERPVFQPVPDAGRGDGLLLVDARHVADVEAPEVDELARRVDLGLVCGLRLAEHGRGVQRLAPGAGEQLGRAQQHGRALLPRRARPVVPGLAGGGDRALDLRLPALVHGREHVRAVVRLDGLERLAGAHLLAADHERDVELLRLEAGEPNAQLLALGRAGRIAPDRLVEGLGDAGDAVGAHAVILRSTAMAVTQVGYEIEGWGVGELWLEGETVVWHELPWPGRRARVVEGRHELVERLRGYFAGEPETFEDVAVDLEYETPFLERCARSLRDVPRGEVVTYGELAALAGAPGAARAAGTFCARNRLGLFVPCHRVVAAGGLGSYGSFGVEYKRRLLELEHAALCGSTQRAGAARARFGLLPPGG